jgi:hypothetical protein
MFVDNQFFKSVEDKMKGGDSPNRHSLLYTPDDYDTTRQKIDCESRAPINGGVKDETVYSQTDYVLTSR